MAEPEISNKKLAKATKVLPGLGFGLQAAAHARQTETSDLLSRRDRMMVARHEMPGEWNAEARPGGYGMMTWPGCPITQHDGQQGPARITPFPTGRVVSAIYQAFHASLPSFRPSGTQVSFVRLTHMGSTERRRVHLPRVAPFVRHSSGNEGPSRKAWRRWIRFVPPWLA
jgi:hypothetical protein